MIHPSSPQAHSIDTLWDVSLIISTVVYVVVIISLIIGTYRAYRRSRSNDSSVAPSDLTLKRVVVASTLVTVAILIVFLGYTFATIKDVNPKPASDELRIQVVGHQWWWEVNYIDPDPQNYVKTANEIHVPTGRPISLELLSRDVIHSFFVPALQGKMDLIPGRLSKLQFKVDTPGVYRGQCAEFCGHQHAFMAFYVVAHSPNDFYQWVYSQRKSASPPSDSLRKQGEKIFLSGTCAVCHNITGTLAGGTLGPDLTHLGSRTTIAAGILDNTDANLGRWILNPHKIKPGVRMPSNQLAENDLRALVAYLEGLK